MLGPAAAAAPSPPAVTHGGKLSLLVRHQKKNHGEQFIVFIYSNHQTLYRHRHRHRRHRGGCVRRLETDLEMRNVMRNSNITLHSTQQQRRVRPADAVTVITNMLPLCASTCRIVDTPAHCRGLGRPLTRPPPPPTNNLFKQIKPVKI